MRGEFDSGGVHINDTEVSVDTVTCGAVGETDDAVNVVAAKYGWPVSSVSPTALVATTANTYSDAGRSPDTVVVKSVIAVLPSTWVYVVGSTFVFQVAGVTHAALVSLVASEHLVGPDISRRYEITGEPVPTVVQGSVVLVKSLANTY